MNNRSRLKHLLLLSLLLWLAAASLTGYLTYGLLPLLHWIIMLILLGAAGLISLMALNQSQAEVSQANREHSRTKRQVQEHQLKLDRYDYDAKKSAEVRRIVLNSTQEKDHSLRNMALALDHAMDEMLDLLKDEQGDVTDQIRTRAEGMKRYSADLQGLARLELKSELPARTEVNFLQELQRLVEQWNAFGKSHKVKIRVDNPEEQMPLYIDMLWVENLLTRIVQALIRMNHNTTLHVHIIGYTDAELGDALRIELAIDGRELTDTQLKYLMTEYVSIIEDGQEVGPGLAFVVARRMTQLLDGNLDVTNGARGTEVLVVLPRNPTLSEESDDSAAF